MSTKMKKLSFVTIITLAAIATILFGGVITQKLFAQATTVVPKVVNTSKNCTGPGSGECLKSNNPPYGCSVD